MMAVHLKINGTDVSGFLAEQDYCVAAEPVYDPESEFVNIYGDTVRSRSGTKITVSARLTDADDDTAAVLREAAQSRNAVLEYSFPGAVSGDFEVTGCKVALDKVYRGQRRWKCEFSACGFVRYGL